MSTVVLIDLRPSQRETSRIGTPFANAIEAKKCRRLPGVYLALSSASIRPADTHTFLK
ncbi:hypothetical protein SAMN05216505_103121 [Streptomyces prasinopilosus]|uniref:Uncharacterized protein n=1 Tax=Streptomyces prasinopilosus TaxID=67344 RepID=A0A1G6NHN4_9ACTN|nr:hypothetical protein SAMN05216505_103121 [Streptomyces prasinopilosus]